MRGKKATTEQIIAVLKEAAAGPRFRRVAAPTPAGIEALLGQIDTRIARHLERRGLRVRDAEGSYLSTGPGEEDGLAALVGHSITYRIAVGASEGRKAFRLQTVAPALEAPAGDERLAKHSGVFMRHIPVPHPGWPHWCSASAAGGRVKFIASIENPWRTRTQGAPRCGSAPPASISSSGK